MSLSNVLKTQRLLLRQWQPSDLLPFQQMNADADVMQYFPKTLNKKESDELVDKAKALIEKNGWGFWALEVIETREFIGFTGLHSPSDELPFSPCIEVGWRLTKTHWKQGYATEAATAALDFAFQYLSVDNIVSFTTVGNKASRGVMNKLGMENTQQNFMHPAIPEHHPLREHVLYKLTKKQWHSGSKSP
jgi:ribosomal-protein-alanine N-acetyltransferase